jgi:hypothetical protein
MLKQLKDAAKRLPYPLFLRIFLAWHFLVQVRRCRRAGSRAGLCCLEEMNLAQVKTSDKLFILGSGSSINNISAERWAAIARHDTVGFNLWLIHPFVPRMYFFEAPFDSESKLFETLQHLMSQRAQDYRLTLKVVTELSNTWPEAKLPIPPEWKGKLYSVDTVPVAARDEREFAYAFAYLLRKGLFHPATRVRYLYKQLSTLSMLLSLAARLQYKAVVLCGVDLKDSRYFYQDAELFPESSELGFATTSVPHATIRAEGWRVPIDRVVLEMKKQVLEPAGIALYVESRDSALFPAVPEAPESLFDQAPAAVVGREVRP